MRICRLKVSDGVAQMPASPSLNREETEMKGIKISETAFTAQILELAQTFGWKTAHFRPGMTSRLDRNGKSVWVTAVQGDGAGFPDLVLVRASRLIFAELKSETGAVKKLQGGWLVALEGIKGAEVYVWKPSDWDLILRILR